MSTETLILKDNRIDVLFSMWMHDTKHIYEQFWRLACWRNPATAEANRQSYIDSFDEDGMYFASRCKIVHDALPDSNEYASDEVNEDYFNSLKIPRIEECWERLEIKCTMRDNEMNSIFISWLEDTKYLNKVFLEILLQRSKDRAIDHAGTFFEYYKHDAYYISRKCALLNNTLDIDSNGNRGEITKLFNVFTVPKITDMWSNMAGFWNGESGELHPKHPNGKSESKSEDENAVIAQLSDLLKRGAEHSEGSGPKRPRMNSPWHAIYTLTKVVAKLQENSIRH